MERTEEITEDARLDRLLTHAPAPAVSATLERRILADFDRMSRRFSFASAWRAVAEAVWPGAPAWQPACAFALSLMIGLGAAAFTPLDLPQSDENAAGLFAFDIDAPQDI
jgi:hypothetical protein